MINKKRVAIFLAVLAILIVLASIFIYKFVLTKEDSFSVKDVLIKMNLPLGKETSVNTKIYNNLRKEQEVTLTLDNLENLAYLEENNFIIKPKESKEIILHINDSQKKVGVYTGRINIFGEFGKKYSVPVVLGIEDPNSPLVILHKKMASYDSPFPGGKLGIEIEVFNLGRNVSDKVEGSYAIKSLEGETIWSEGGEQIITNSEFSKIIPIPKEWKYGDYVLVTTADYNGKKSSSGYLFELSEEKNNYLSNNITFFILALVLVLFAVFIAIIFFIQSRDDLLIKLREQQNTELKKNTDFLNKYKNRIQESTKNFEYKKEKLKEFREKEEKILEDIKKKQREQKKKLKELRKKKTEDDKIKLEMAKWKKQGYDLFEAKKEVGEMSKELMNKEIKNWKKRGYRF